MQTHLQCSTRPARTTVALLGPGKSVSGYPHPPRQIKLRIMLRIKIRARGFWRAFGLRVRSTAMKTTALYRPALLAAMAHYMPAPIMLAD